MRTFDVTLKGFDGGTNKTDHLVKWVRAENKSIVKQWLTLVSIDHLVRSIDEIDHGVTFDDGVDVILSPVMPDLGMPCSVRNYGGLYQIAQKDFNIQEWIDQSKLLDQPSN